MMENILDMVLVFVVLYTNRSTYKLSTLYIVYMGKKQTVNYYNINVSRALTATGQEAGYAQLRFKTGAWLERDGE